MLRVSVFSQRDRQKCGTSLASNLSEEFAKLDAAVVVKTNGGREDAGWLLSSEQGATFPEQERAGSAAHLFPCGTHKRR